MAVAALKELGFPRARRHQEKFISLGGNPFGDLHDVEVAEQEIEAAEADPEDAAASAVPGEDTVAVPAAPVRLEVELDGETHSFDDWVPGTTMLEHLEAKGVKAPFSCREGECSACAVRLLEGEVSMRHNDVLDAEDLADGIRLACQADPLTDVVRASYS
nr:2Fe-2S iron-sulfur cluster binding domain-containing protein [Nocardioides ochotonae]